MIEREYLENRFQPNVDDFKKHLRITSDDQDAMLMMYLKASIESAEHYIGSVIALSKFTQEEVITEKALELRTPVLEIKSVEVEGTALDPSSFITSDNSLEFPEGLYGKHVKVVYLSGMRKVDYDIKASVLLTASDLFANPVDSVRQLPTAASRLLDNHRTWNHGR